MPRAALSSADIAAFRARATGAALRLFAERGFDGVTMRALAEALGCSAMTPYRYLRDKEELFALVRAEAFRRFADAQEAALADGGPVRERLLRLKQAYIEFALAEPDAYRIMFELRQPRGPQTPELAAQSRRAFGCLHGTVAEAVRSGLLEGDALTLSHLLWAHTHGLVSLHLSGKLVLGRSLSELAALDLELPARGPDKSSCAGDLDTNETASSGRKATSKVEGRRSKSDTFDLEPSTVDARLRRGGPG